MNIENTEKQFICECGKVFKKIRSMTGHQANCQIHQKILKEQKESRKLPNGMFKCENPDCQKEHDGSYCSGRFCSKECKNHYVALVAAKTAIKNGNKHAPKNLKRKRAKLGTWKCNECDLVFETRAQLYEHNHLKHPERQGKCIWNKGLTKANSKSIADASVKVSDSVKRAYAEGRLTGRCKDPIKEELRRKKISNTMKKNPKAGGKRHGSGRGKQGWYKGYWCDSSWELAWVIFNIDHNIQFKRYSGYFEYQFNGAKHKYYPDFELEDGTIVEIKGAEKLKQWKAKLEQFPQDKQFQVIGKNEINKYLKYVTEKYGDDFIKLYEK